MAAKKTATKAKRDEQQPQSENAVARRQTTALAVAGAIDFAADSGKGMEGADRDSYAIPFLVVLQPMSPQITEDTVAGAKPGKLLNSVTNDMWDDVWFIPCAFQRRWIRWAPREGGGGYKGDFTTEQAQALRAAGKVKEVDNRLYFPLENGDINEKKCDRLADTRHHFGLLVPSADAKFGVPICFALTSTGIKRSKNFMARIDGIKMTRPDETVFTPPSFSHRYHVTTLKEQNDKGTWWSPIFDDPQPIADASLYAQAKAFHGQISAGGVTLAHDSVAGNAADVEGAGDSGRF